MDDLHRQSFDDSGAQLQLAALNRDRLAPSLNCSDWRDDIRRLPQQLTLEGEFFESLQRSVAPLLDGVPERGHDFVEWFAQLRSTGPGQNDPLFPWLATSASLSEMKWFLAQELAGEAGFEDLTAMTQLRMPTRPKIEMARNYWDEMGRGNPKGMHGPLLHRLADHLDLERSNFPIVAEALALANAMAAMAANRRLAYQSVGALGVIELTAPGRAAQVDTGLKRLGVDARNRHYFSLHAVLDVRHAVSWLKEVVEPLVETIPGAAHAIAEGALIRLQCGERCFERYREALWGSAKV